MKEALDIRQVTSLDVIICNPYSVCTLSYSSPNKEI